jgi:penicillin amidase
MLFLFVTPLRASPPPKGCDVAIDNREIIRARADSDLSWYACLGYVHGRYRSFQLDLYRRTYQGRRAEILGKSQLKTDIFMRLLRLASRAEKLFDELPNEAREKFWIYAQGVAKGMTDREERFSLEFKKLGYEPEPWHPVDTMGILLLESVDQTQESFRNDFIEDGWKKVHGENARQLFDLRGLPWTTSITKELGAPHASAPLFQEPSLPTDDHSIQEILKSLPEPFQGGSNNWVVASKRSRTKHAWLANDPHLPLTSPPFWLWVDVEGPVRHAIGATVPGIPVVVSGTNGFVSWGLTTSLTDNANVYSVPRSATTVACSRPSLPSMSTA